MAHAFFYLTILLTLVTCSHQKEDLQIMTVDWNYTMEIFRSYLCTGSQDWYKKIPDPMLKFIIHAQIESYCRRHPESLNEIVVEARYAVEVQPPWKRNEVSRCLLSGIKNEYLAPIVCTTSKKFMENLDTFTDFVIQDSFCSAQHKNVWMERACMIGKWMIENREAIRKAVRPVVCKIKNQHDRVKRQYDMKSVIATFELAACAQSSGFHDFATKEGLLHFPFYGFWCCITKFFDR